MRKDSRSRFNIDGWGEVQKHTLRTYPALMFPNQINDHYNGLKTLDLSDGVPDEESGNDVLTLINSAEWYRAWWVKMPKTGHKLSPDLVRAVETAINNEYMPFSIQDLRTNELISLPAFITSVSDSFSAEYTDSHGFGRTDPVKTYGKTTRSVDVTFRLAAQSKEDHDYMWYVINRMVAMLYPQRSPGRKRAYDNGGKEMIQPFSQVPTASPMVRLRLGDLISSNYNKMGLGRLFGHPGRGFNPQTETGKKAKEEQNKKDAMAKFRPGFMAKIEADLDDIIGNNDFKGKINIPKNTVLFLWSSEETGKKSRSKAMKTITFKKAAIIEIGEMEVLSRKTHGPAIPKGKSPTAYKFKFNMSDQNPAIKNVKNPATALFGKALGRWVSFGDKGQKEAKFSGFIPKFNQEWLKGKGVMEPEKARRLKEIEKKFLEGEGIKEGFKVAPADVNKEFESFMKPENNPIVKSFRSGMGRGLAGFITQMSLGYDGANWEIDKGSRAPTMVEIQMSFAPTHDLPLGLDATGQLSAASHPVGAAYTNPWASGIQAEPPESAAGDPEGTYAEGLQAAANSDAEQRIVDSPNPVNAKPADPQIPPSPPGATLGGFNPMSLMSAAGGLSALKGLF